MERERAKPLEGIVGRRLRLMLIVVCCVLCGCVLCCSRVHFLCGANKNVTKQKRDRCAKQNWRAAGVLRIFRFFLVFRSSGYTYCDLWCNQATYYHDMSAIR